MMASVTRCLVRAILPVVMTAAAHAGEPAAVRPVPRIAVTQTGAAAASPVTVERTGAVKAGAALLARFKAKLPGGKLPAEGYLLETGPAGALVVAADDAGERHARRTLAAWAGGAVPRVAVADWPVMAWRGLHVLDGGPESLPLLKRLVHERLGPARANVLIYEIDYNFAFTSHPEIKGRWTKAQVRELVAACRDEGIRIIPEINCLGHQSWKAPPGELLRAHPEFEEPPDAKTEQTDPAHKGFYCRSWCPSNPQVNPFVCDLIDELLDAFEADAFHAGMDEVFVLASSACPRCRGLNPADVYARAVNDLHAHLAKRGATMLMWADRLLDGKATGYGDWEGATNGTHPALHRISKDIILCDWHYDPLAAYPSLSIFAEAGFRTWPSVWKDPKGAESFLAAARARNDSRVLGALATTWINASRMAATLFGDATAAPGWGDQELPIAANALAVIASAWNPAPR